jgi:hypothetical protein
MNMARLAVLFLVLLLGAPASRAEQAITVGEYTIHYNALSTEALDPAVAKTYGIQRSRSRALLNVTLLKKNMGISGQPVRGKVKATAANLNAQLRTIDMREITESGAIYYIGEVAVSNEDTLKFTVEVTPEGATEPAVIRFDQQFFTK